MWFLRSFFLWGVIMYKSSANCGENGHWASARTWNGCGGDLLPASASTWSLCGTVMRQEDSPSVSWFCGKVENLLEKFFLSCKLSCVLLHNVFIIFTNEVLQDEIYLMDPYFILYRNLKWKVRIFYAYVLFYLLLKASVLLHTRGKFYVLQYLLLLLLLLLLSNKRCPSLTSNPDLLVLSILLSITLSSMTVSVEVMLLWKILRTFPVTSGGARRMIYNFISKPFS